MTLGLQLGSEGFWDDESLSTQYDAVLYRQFIAVGLILTHLFFYLFFFYFYFIFF